MLIPHVLDRLDQLYGVYVEDSFGIRVITEFNVVAREAKDVLDIQGYRSQDVALQPDAIGIAAQHLHHRIQAYASQYGAGGQAAQAYHAGLMVGDIESVGGMAYLLAMGLDHPACTALGRSYLRSDGEMAGIENLLQVAA
jgi:hypothetical protein